MRIRALRFFNQYKKHQFYSPQKMTSTFQMRTLSKNTELAESFDVYLCNEYSLPSFAIKFLKEEAESYEARHDDIYISSYPKTGTTWLQEIVSLIHSNLDFDSALNINLHERFPYIEHSNTNFNLVKTMQSPRLLKTHLPYSLLPEDIIKKQCKILYITRNPRDVSVSYYHFAKMLKETQYKGSFEQFFERFLQDRPTYGPFLQHNLEFWNVKDNKNVLFLFYEDLKNDISTNLNKIAEFLGKRLTPEDINSIVEFCSFKSMAKKEATTSSGLLTGNHFFRKGEVGDWKNYFTEEMVCRLDKKVEDVLKDSDLKYTYEL